MLTRKGNLICKALVFTFAVITAMTMDSCCDDCLGGSKGDKNHNPFDNKNNNNLINNNPKHGGTETSDKDTETGNKDKETAGFKKTNDGNLWIFGTPLFYSAKNGKFYSVKNGDLCVEEGEKKDNCNIFEDILIKYLKGFNSNYKDIKIENIKTLIVGDAVVGKSQICRVGTEEGFESNYSSTVGFEFFSKKFKIDDNIFNFKIWDTCGGKEEYMALIKSFYSNVDIIILVYDVTSKDAFKSLDKLYNEIINSSGRKGTAIFVVGNKCDLIEEKGLAAQEKRIKNWIKSKCKQK